MTFETCKRLCFIVGFSLVLSLLCARSEETPAQATRPIEWHLSLIPYYWGTDLDLSLSNAYGDFDVDESFLSREGRWKPNVVGFGLEAERKGLTWIMAGEAMNADMDLTLADGRDAELLYQNQRLAFALGYRFMWPKEPRAKWLLQPWLGFRLHRAEQRILLDDDETIESKIRNEWVDPLVGVRAQWFPSKSWSLGARREATGYEQDHYRLSALAYAKWHLRREFSVSLGYRYDDFQQSGKNGWTADGQAHGVVAAVELDFNADPTPNPVFFDHHLYGQALPHTNTDAQPQPELDPQEKKDRSWLDKTHDYPNEKLESGVSYADRSFVDESTPLIDRYKSRFELGINTRVIEDEGVDFEVRPEGRVDLDLPNLKRKAYLVVTSSSVDEKPGEDRFDQERSLNIGFEIPGIFLKKTKTKIGIRGDFDFYAAAVWEPYWLKDRWYIGPIASVYYRSDKGFGSIGAIEFRYRIQDRFRAVYLPSIEYYEKRDETEWLHNLLFTYVFEGDEWDYRRAIFTRFSAFGTFESGPLLYRWLPVYYRTPLYKKWLYLEMGPEIEWHDRSNWEPAPGFRVAVNALFWGTADR